MYMQFMIFAITLYKFLHYDLHIYIYININSYIMILYTCCDIKHACIHDFVYHAYVQFRNGDAIPQLDKLRAARSTNNAVKYMQRSCKTEKAQA